MRTLGGAGARRSVRRRTGGAIVDPAHPRGTRAPVAADHDGGNGMTTAHDIPTAHTPEGGYGDTMPSPFLADCDDALAPGAPDLRGTWRAVAAAAVGGDPLPADHPIHGHV